MPENLWYKNLTVALRACEERRLDPCDKCPFEYGDERCRSLGLDAADAIEELLKENDELENSGRLLMAAFARLKEKMPHWISVEEEGLPKTYFQGYPSQEEFLVVVAERWRKREEWEYHVDSALNWGTYIDDFWDTKNDWHEGQEVHVVAYMPFPEPLRRPPKGVE